MEVTGDVLLIPRDDLGQRRRQPINMKYGIKYRLGRDTGDEE